MGNHVDNSGEKKEALWEKVVTVVLALSIVAVAIYFDIAAPL